MVNSHEQVDEVKVEVVREVIRRYMIEPQSLVHWVGYVEVRQGYQNRVQNKNHYKALDPCQIIPKSNAAQFITYKPKRKCCFRNRYSWRWHLFMGYLSIWNGYTADYTIQVEKPKYIWYNKIESVLEKCRPFIPNISTNLQYCECLTWEHLWVF